MCFQDVKKKRIDDSSSVYLSERDIVLKESNREIMESMKRLYKAKIYPLEQKYKFDFFMSSMNDGDFDSRPMVLLLGQYSVGKTSFIRHILERDFPGCRIGPEPTTDRFVAISYGDTERVVPGNAAAVDVNRPFIGLGKFGTAFLNRFEISEVPSPLLDTMILVDTPGVLSGEKQRLERGYDFEGSVRWFAERADRILLLFDAHKLDISDEFKRVISVLKGHDDKVKVVLNKADQVDNQQLMRVYGALMWSLGKVVKTPEVVRVYMGSFWDEPLNMKGAGLADLFEREKDDLLADLRALQRGSALRKVNEMVKRARLVKGHALLIEHLRAQLPIFGKEKKQKKLTADLENQMQLVMRAHNVAPGDFPDLKRSQLFLETYALTEFSELNHRLIDIIDNVLARDIPKILDTIQEKQVANEKAAVDENLAANPFETASGAPLSAWIIDSTAKAKYDNMFYTLNPVGNPPKVSGGAARPIMVQSGLPVEALKKIWDLSDIDKDGYLDQDEFSLAMYLIYECRTRGAKSLPDTLPPQYIPPSKRAAGGPKDDIFAPGGSVSGVESSSEQYVEYSGGASSQNLYPQTSGQY